MPVYAGVVPSHTIGLLVACVRLFVGPSTVPGSVCVCGMTLCILWNEKDKGPFLSLKTNICTITSHTVQTSI